MTINLRSYSSRFMAHCIATARSLAAFRLLQCSFRI